MCKIMLPLNIAVIFVTGTKVTPPPPVAFVPSRKPYESFKCPIRLDKEAVQTFYGLLGRMESWLLGSHGAPVQRTWE